MKLTKLLYEGLEKYGLQAAIALPDGEIFTGRSHAEAVINLHKKYPDFDFDVNDLGDVGMEDEVEDGFWDTKRNKFITRDEAFKIVYGDGDDFDQLHSGDV
jgi:hypothetical protein